MTWTDLAIRLGTTRPSLAEWRKLDGAPETADIESWVAFVELRGLGRTSSRKLTELRAEVEAEKLRKLKRENEIAEGRTISIDDVTGYLTELAAKLDLLITQKVETDLPVLCLGQPIADIRAQCRRKHDEIREITHAGLWSGYPNWTT